MGSGAVSFVVLASLVGVTIVFIFLALLSLLMVLIRSFDHLLPYSSLPEEHHARQTSAAGVPLSASARPSMGASPPKGIPGTFSGVPTVPVWAVAAVARYLELEDERDRISAAVWTRRGDA